MYWWHNVLFSKRHPRHRKEMAQFSYLSHALSGRSIYFVIYPYCNSACSILYCVFVQFFASYTYLYIYIYLYIYTYTYFWYSFVLLIPFCLYIIYLSTDPFTIYPFIPLIISLGQFYMFSFSFYIFDSICLFTFCTQVVAYFIRVFHLCSLYSWFLCCIKVPKQ